jgi:hypothetical protein
MRQSTAARHPHRGVGRLCLNTMSYHQSVVNERRLELAGLSRAHLSTVLELP